MLSFIKTVVLASGCLLSFLPGVRADEADVLNLNASLSSLHDSNLFRLSPSADPKALGVPARDDTITTTTLDFKLNKLFSLQRIIATVSMVDYRYKRNDYLDFRALNYDAKWQWAVGRRWTGDLAFERKEALNAFSDYTSYRRRNVRTTEEERFVANYWFHSNWASLVGVSRSRLTNEQPFLADSDYAATGYHLGMRYQPASGNVLTVKAARLDGEYTKRQFNSAQQYDTGFVQDVYGLDAAWRLTGQSAWRGRLEYLRRTHDHFSGRDFAGWIGGLDYTYAYSGKGSLGLGYKRGLEAFQQSTSSYYVLDEVSVNGQWAATAQVTGIIRLGYGMRTYRGEIAPLPAGTSPREDKVSRLGFDLAYQPARWLQIRAGIGFENRNVNNDLLDYKDRTGFVSASAQY